MDKLAIIIFWVLVAIVLLSIFMSEDNFIKRFFKNKPKKEKLKKEETFESIFYTYEKVVAAKKLIFYLQDGSERELELTESDEVLYMDITSRIIDIKNSLNNGHMLELEGTKELINPKFIVRMKETDYYEVKEKRYGYTYAKESIPVGAEITNG